MALDPSVLAATAHPQIADPVEQMGQALAFRANVQKLQSGAMELQQQQRALAAQTALDQAMQQALTTNPDGTQTFNHDAIANVMTQRGFGHMVPGLQKSWTEADKAKADLNLTNQNITKLQNEAQQQQQKQTAFLAQGVIDANYNPDAAITAIAHSSLPAAAKNAFTQQIQANPTADAIKALVDPIAAQSEDVQKMLTERQTAQAHAKQAETQATRLRTELPGIQADTLQKQVNTAATGLAQAADRGNFAQALQALPPEVQQRFSGLGQSPTGMDVMRAALTPEQKVTTGLTAAGQAQTAAHERVLESQGAQRIAIERRAQQINEQRWGFEQGGGVSPQALAIAKGQVSPQTARMMLRSNPGLLAQVQTATGGEFSEGKLDQFYNAVNSLTPGGKGTKNTAITALNTLVHHTDLALDAIDALNHGNFVPGNAAYDAIRGISGKAEPNNFNTIKNFISGEAAKVAQGGVPHEGEVKDAAAALTTKGSPDQLKGALNTLMTIAGGRMVPLIQEGKSAGLTNKYSWDDTSPDFTVVQPDTKAILQRRGYDVTTLKPIAKAGAGGAGAIGVQAPDGKTYYFSSQQQADNFKKKAGIP